MSRCYFLEDKLLRSSTKKLFVGGINRLFVITLNHFEVNPDTYW